MNFNFTNQEEYTLNTSDKVTLYIATHNRTGKKYFGKTTRWFTEYDLQEHYHGSGKYWKNHLKKHNDDVTMSIYGIFDISEVKDVALQFSEEDDIVKSDVWANLKYENGLDGNPKGIIFTEEHKRKLSKPKTEEHKRKLSIAVNNNGKNNPMYGKHHTLEAKNKISKIHKNKKIKNKTKKLISESTSGKNNPMYGKHHTLEAKNKISKSKKGVKQEIIVCPYCNRSNMLRYHFNNCKERTNEL